MNKKSEKGFLAPRKKIIEEMKVLSSEKKEFSLTELNKPMDWMKLPAMAKKHVPVIEAPKKIKANEPFMVKVKVGGIEGVEHPNTLSHWINWVALYAGERLISKVEFGAELSDQYVVNLNVTLNESATLKAQEFCNLHGVWEGKATKVMVE
jgi:superoxide reductase